MSAALSKAAQEIVSERARQVSHEGWTAAHDDEHSAGELSMAAICYCIAASVATKVPPEPGEYIKTPAAGFWPWGDEWWKPKTPRRDLVRAAALIIAEIERLDRAEARGA